MFRAKAKKKGKAKRKKASAPAALDETDEAVDASSGDEVGEGDEAEELDMDEVSATMDGHIEWLQREYAQLRVGAASPAMLDHIMVPAYDGLVPLPQLAQVAAPSPQLIVCNVFDPSTSAAIAEAVRSSGLNLNPQDDGAVVKVPIPKTTRETRENTAKLAAKLVEETKLAIRRVRKRAMAVVKAQVGISEDDIFRMTKEVQAATDAAVDRATAEYNKKRESIMND